MNRRIGTPGAAIVGAVGSTGSAVLATLCCVGPVTYSALGAGGVPAAARLAPWRPWLLAASAGFLALGFWSVYRRRAPVDRAACPVRAARWTRITLWIAAVLTIAVAILPEVL
jgi:mercuric ion transport protein